MEENNLEILREKERILRFGWNLSLMAPLVSGLAFYQSGSLTLLADFFRRSFELLVIFNNWRIIKKIIRNQRLNISQNRIKEEEAGVRGILMAMVLSFFFTVFNIFREIKNPSPLGNIGLGLFIGLAGLWVNSFFWQKNKILAKREESPMFFSQWRLYRLKALMDINIVLTLILSRALEESIYANHIDIVGSIIISLFLLKTIYDLVNRLIKS